MVLSHVRQGKAQGQTLSSHISHSLPAPSLPCQPAHHHLSLLLFHRVENRLLHSEKLESSKIHLTFG